MSYIYKGRKKITIPVSYETFNENPIKWIKKYISSCVSTNLQNKKEIDSLYNVYKGDQDIKNKVRLDKNNNNNNKIVFNHIWRQVEFKKGFMVGDAIEYSNTTTNVETDDMTYFKKYLRDSHKASLDVTKYEQLYICGVATTFIMPRKDDFDVINETPYLLSVLKPCQGFVVYTDDVTNKPLFNVIITNTPNLKDNSLETFYEIYYMKNGELWTFTISDKNYDIVNNIEKNQTYKFLPLTEYCLNEDRMGIVELVLGIQNLLNTTRSNQVDDIVDFVNAYIVFYNQKFNKNEKDEFFELKSKRIISVKTNNPQCPADVKLLKQSLDHTDINVFYDGAKNEMYDISATPQSSGNVTSGGDTGSARLLGNGWESAQNQAKVDTAFLIQYEYEQLKKMLMICKDTIGNPIQDVSASDIEIKFSINMSNNILVKAQSLKYLYDMNMPEEEALAMTGMTSDTHGVAEKWKIKNQKLVEENKTDISNE